VRFLAVLLPVAVALSAALPAQADTVKSPSTSGKDVPWSGDIQAAGTTPAVVRLMKNQAAVDKVADLIEAASTETSATAGIAGLVVDPANRAINLYWHGDLPAAVSQQVSAAGATGIGVHVTQAPYTRSQLLSETQRLAALSTAQSTSKGAHVVSVSPMPDGSGLDVGMSGVPANVSAAQASQLVPYLASTVRFTVAGDVSPVADTRQADTPPFWGGALIVQGNTACSTGFGVTGNNGAATYILTAAHCGEGAWTTGAGDAVGNTIPAGVDWGHDGELILTSAGSGVYDGDSIAGGNQFFKTVVGASASHVGDSLCTSGSFSGAVCGITVVRINEALTVDGHAMTLVRAEQGGHVGASGNGDSGGPVFSLANNNANDVARGTLTAHDSNTNVPCQGVPTDANRTCGWRFWYPDITLQANAIGFHVNVG
jgi:hypothetical protein